MSLRNGSKLEVIGFDMPFSNPGHSSEGWLLRNQPIVGQRTLMDILNMRNFVFVAGRPMDALAKRWDTPLPAPFRYPYGTEHSWDLDRYKELMQTCSGDQFLTAWGFDDDNEHVAAMTQSQAQDVAWLANNADSIRRHNLQAYFVPKTEGHNAFFVIIPGGKELGKQFPNAWRHLLNADTGFHLDLVDADNEDNNADWDVKVVEATQMHRALDSHNLNFDADLVLEARPTGQGTPRRPAAFSTRRAADDALRIDGRS